MGNIGKPCRITRIVSKVGLEANPHNSLLMRAMGPNVAGVIGSAVAAGILIHFAS
jgi:oxaloacetate decarboxylase beta subunit